MANLYNSRVGLVDDYNVIKDGATPLLKGGEYA